MATETISINPNCNFLKPVNPDGMRYDLNSEMIRSVRSLSIPTGATDGLCKRARGVVNTIQPSPKRLQVVDENPGAEAKKKKNNNIRRANSESISGNLDLCPPYGMTSVIGRRQEMEDTVAIVPSFCKGSSSSSSAFLSDLHFFGVYDGHGGSQSSVFCREHLHQALAQELTTLPASNGCCRDRSEWEKAMKNSFTEMDVQVGGMCPTGNCCYEGDTYCATCCKDPVGPENVGSTAVVAVVSRSQLVVANCGDSRAVLCRGGKAIPFSHDHKPDREDEMNRIEAAGGQIVYWNGYRVGGFLSMSRAIGDRFLKRYVISEPEVSCTERTEEDEFLILASDGLWDVISNECACEVAGKCLAGYRPRRLKGMNEDCGVAVAASVLTKLAMAHGSSDNVSVIVIDLKNKRRKRSRYVQ